MTYATSEAAGKGPIELYRVVMGSSVYSYTSSDTTTVFNAGAGDETYTPAPIIREAITADQVTTKGQLGLTVPVSNPIAALFLNGAAPALVTCQIIRFHRGDDISAGMSSPNIAVSPVYQIAGCARKGANSKLALAQPLRVLQDSVPRQKLQIPCNHAFCDLGCGVDPTTIAQTGTITTIDADTGTQLTVTLGTTALPPSRYLYGKLTFGAFTAAIAGHSASSGSVATIALLSSIPGLVAGSSISLIPGCDHSIFACGTYYANLKNHAGWPDLPRTDPWSNGQLVLPNG